jgi:hypothetical protein
MTGGRTRIQRHFEGETVWLTQAQLAERTAEEAP